MDTHQKSPTPWIGVLYPQTIEHEKIETKDWLANVFTKIVGS